MTRQARQTLGNDLAEELVNRAAGKSRTVAAYRTAGQPPAATPPPAGAPADPTVDRPALNGADQSPAGLPGATLDAQSAAAGDGSPLPADAAGDPTDPPLDSAADDPRQGATLPVAATPMGAGNDLVDSIRRRLGMTDSPTVVIFGDVHMPGIQNVQSGVDKYQPPLVRGGADDQVMP